MIMTDEIDALPYAAVRVSDSGKVLAMNRVAAERSGIQRWRARGRDYQKEIVPVLQRRNVAVVVVR